MIITIPGPPIRQRRARSKNGQRPYDPQKKEKKAFILQARQQMKAQGAEMFEKGTALYMYFYFALPRPKSHYRTGKNRHLLKASAPEYPCTSSTADLDNYVKFVKDCLNGLAYHDDCQVVTYDGSHKRYCELEKNPYTMIAIHDMGKCE